jgi:Carbohydrate-binding module 48 (Isoamylase N-terminal domain)
MTESQDLMHRIVETLKEPVHLDRSLNDRVMSAIENLPSPEEAPVRSSVFSWLLRPRTVQLSPMTGLAWALGVAALAVFGARVTMSGGAAPVPTSESGVGHVIQFVLVAPTATSVSLVGDFNDWDRSATPLVRSNGDGLWSVTVPLETGRYRYSFLLDGTTWLQDPNGVPAIEDEFGRPNSVVTVGGV